MVELGESNDGGRSIDQVVFTSRKTILDRPCWRDDQVSLDNDKSYRVEVFVCSGR